VVFVEAIFKHHLVSENASVRVCVNSYLPPPPPLPLTLISRYPFSLFSFTQIPTSCVQQTSSCPDPPWPSAEEPWVSKASSPEVPVVASVIEAAVVASETEAASVAVAATEVAVEASVATEVASEAVVASVVTVDAELLEVVTDPLTETVAELMCLSNRETNTPLVKR